MLTTNCSNNYGPYHFTEKLIPLMIVNALAGKNLPIYGDGQQKTGLISLTDTIENFFDFAAMDVKPGDHVTVHNFTHRLSIEQIAQRIAASAPDAVVNYIRNPREEPAGKLSRAVEVHPAIKARHTKKELRLQSELDRLMEFTMRYRDNIDTSIIMPKVAWKLGESATQLPVQPVRGMAGKRAYAFYERVIIKR